MCICLEYENEFSERLDVVEDIVIYHLVPHLDFSSMVSCQCLVI